MTLPRHPPGLDHNTSACPAKSLSYYIDVGAGPTSADFHGLRPSRPSRVLLPSTAESSRPWLLLAEPLGSSSTSGGTASQATCPAGTEMQAPDGGVGFSTTAPSGRLCSLKQLVRLGFWAVTALQPPQCRARGLNCNQRPPRDYVAFARHICTYPATKRPWRLDPMHNASRFPTGPMPTKIPYSMT